MQSSFIANLDTLKWMDEVTRDKARVKAKAMGKVLGYPEWLLDPLKLDKYYEEVCTVDCMSAKTPPAGRPGFF